MTDDCSEQYKNTAKNKKPQHMFSTRFFNRGLVLPRLSPSRCPPVEMATIVTDTQM